MHLEGYYLPIKMLLCICASCSYIVSSAPISSASVEAFCLSTQHTTSMFPCAAIYVSSCWYICASSALLLCVPTLITYPKCESWGGDQNLQRARSVPSPQCQHDSQILAWCTVSLLSPLYLLDWCQRLVGVGKAGQPSASPDASQFGERFACLWLVRHGSSSSWTSSCSRHDSWWSCWRRWVSRKWPYYS